jgi:hypothetical protein
MATALEQLLLLPLGGTAHVGSRGIEHVLKIGDAAELFPHRFIWLTLVELAVIKTQKIEVGFNYPVGHLITVLGHLPELPLVK